MTAATPPLRPVLRLVYPPGYPGAPASDERGLHEAPVEVAPPPPARRVKAAAREIVRENRRASSLEPSQAREILTMRVADMLQGGRAAVLTHERRARALRIARILGVRDFDAHLIIAVVQDRARRGEIAVADAEPPADQPAQSRRSPRVRLSTDLSVMLLQAAAAVLLAAALLLGAARWLG
ncbi:MAG: hypothetical protein ACTS27_02100 [Phycisphaerales bacterium]